MLTVAKEIELKNNNRERFNQKLTLENLDFTDPYWLKKDWSLGTYTVNNQELIGKPETPRTVKVFFNLNIDEHNISIEKNVIYRYSKRDKGELYEPFEILPRVTTKLKEKVILFSDNKSKEVLVSVRSGANNVDGKLSLEVPSGWKVSPKSIDISIQQKGDERAYEFTVTPTQNDSEGKIKPIVTIDGKKYTKD